MSKAKKTHVFGNYEVYNQAGSIRLKGLCGKPIKCDVPANEATCKNCVRSYNRRVEQKYIIPQEASLEPLFTFPFTSLMICLFISAFILAYVLS